MGTLVLSGATSGSTTLQPTDATTQTLTLPGQAGNLAVYQSVFSLKNRIINGAMVINQRGWSGTVSSGNDQYTLDRWDAIYGNGGWFSVAQSSTAPTGFVNSLLVTSTGANTADIDTITQKIEGFNTYDLMFGTANAKTVTLSFWVRSSLTGTFGGALANSGRSRSYPFSYTINSANTWEYKTITIAGDTSGTWVGATNGIGLYVDISLGCNSTYSGTAGAWASADYRSATGATSVVGTNGATFYITGVQLEVGSAATTFDYRMYGTELALCQRYYWQCVKVMGQPYLSDTIYNSTIQFPITMRTTPTLASSSTFTARSGSNGTPAISTGVTGLSASPDAVWVYNSASNWTISNSNQVTLNGGFSAEL